MDHFLRYAIAISTIIAVAGGIVLYAINSWFEERIAEARERDNKLNEQAKISCTSESFYNSNFERCERLEVRPTISEAKA